MTNNLESRTVVFNESEYNEEDPAGRLYSMLGIPSIFFIVEWIPREVDLLLYAIVIKIW